MPILNNKKLFGRALLILATLIWGSSFVLMKNALNSVSPYLILFIRFSLAFFTLALIFFPKLKKIDKSYILSGGVLGALLISAYVFQTVGLSGTTPGKNAVLTASYCVFVPFMAWIVSKRRPDIFNVLAAFLCIIGIALVAIQVEGEGGGNFLSSFFSSLKIGAGDSLTLVGGVLFAAHIVCLSTLASNKDPVLITTIQFGFCSIISLILQFVLGTGFKGIELETDVLLSLGYLSFICTALTLLMQTIGQKYTPPSEASILLSLESVYGVIFSMLLYKGENPTLRFWIGFALIFLAIIFSETKLSFVKNIFGRFAHKKSSEIDNNT